MVDHTFWVLAAGRYVHWAVVQISLTNLLIIAGMVVLFVVALVVPFPKSKEQAEPGKGDSDGIR
jgi:hypothetical protein